MTADLSTTYLGLALDSPVVASSSPLTGTIDELRKLEDAGVAAVVLPSVFQEQIVHEGDEPDRRLDLVADAKGALGIPVIASLNGTTRGPWVRHARLCRAGRDSARGQQSEDEVRAGTLNSIHENM